MEKDGFGIWSSYDDYNFSNNSSFFSTSLHVVPNDEHVDNHSIRDLLPDNEEELLAGILEGFHRDSSTSNVYDFEECDLFGSGGGLEIDSHTKQGLGLSFGVSRLTLSDLSDETTSIADQNCLGTNNTEQSPKERQPARTLFVRNVNINVDDSELRNVFKPYGDIEKLYTACKERGFVMITYYDIRAAQNAMCALQKMPLRRRKMDIHFSIPKPYPSDKDLNQGTLVVFNLEPSVSDEELLKIFRVYGDVEKIRDAPHKKNQKFVEYYDTRAAETALKSLNRRLAGNITLQPSRPKEAHRNLSHLNQDLDQDKHTSFRHQMGFSYGNSPTTGNWPRFGHPVEQPQLSILGKSPDFRSLDPSMSNISALASVMHPQSSNSMRVAPTGMEFMRSSALEHMMNNGNSNHQNAFPGSASPFVASSLNGSGIGTLSGPQSFWDSPKVYSESAYSSSLRRTQPFGHPLPSIERTPYGFSFSGHRPFLGPMQGHSQSLHHNHVGSAPSGIPFERHMSFRHDPQQEAFMSHTPGGFDFRPPMDRNFMMNPVAGNYVSTSDGILPTPKMKPMFINNVQYPGISATSLGGFHNTSGHVEENYENEIDANQQFQLDLEKIKSGEDSRTTLMIRNIPNKYTSKLLLKTINEHNLQGTYDFLYLPIDFKNETNVGYAFINMVSPSHIIPLYEAFNGKKWKKFDSEKIACLAYGRIQGKKALVSHFKKSNVMKVKKSCRPVVVQPEGGESSDQEEFQVYRSNGSDKKESSGSAVEEISNGSDKKELPGSEVEEISSE